MDLSFSLKASLWHGRSVLCALFLCFPVLSLIFESFTFGFLQWLETAENTIFLIKENISNSGLDGTMILYTILARFATLTEIWRTIPILATRKWGEWFLHGAPLILQIHLHQSVRKVKHIQGFMRWRKTLAALEFMAVLHLSIHAVLENDASDLLLPPVALTTILVVGPIPWLCPCRVHWSLHRLLHAVSLWIALRTAGVLRSLPCDC